MLWDYLVAPSRECQTKSYSAEIHEENDRNTFSGRNFNHSLQMTEWFEDGGTGVFVGVPKGVPFHQLTV